MTTFGGIAPGDSSIMIFSPVHPFRHFRGFIHECFSVERSYKILGSTTTERPTRIKITDQDPFLQFRTFNGQFYQIGTFPNTSMSTLSFTEITFISPILQVGWRINLHLLPYGENHNPFLGTIMPNHFRITEITLRRSQNRITRVLFKSLSIIKTVSHALYLAITCWSIKSNNGTGTKSGSIILIHYTRTTENSP